MNKKILFAAFTFAAMAISCTEHELEEVNIPASDAIALNPSTAVTRATVLTLDSLKRPEGFVVYAESGASPSAWYDNGSQAIDGRNNHVWNVPASKWGFDRAVPWPTDPREYPMMFYAFYPANPNTAGGLFDVYPKLESNVRVPRNVKEQVDMLFGISSTTGKPASGSLVMTFKHIFSKVNFAVANIDPDRVPSTTQTAYVLALGFMNLGNVSTFKYKTGLWDPNLKSDSRDTFDYYNAFVSSYPVPYVPKVFHNAATPEKFFNGADSNLMLLPQTPPVWNTAASPVVAPTPNQAYVAMIYRIEERDNADYIGFEHASSHSGYATSFLEAEGYDGPLFVKVGYAYSANWEMGKSYLYNISLPGETGGRLLSEYLYDVYGRETDLKAPGEVPEVIISSEVNIILQPVVTDWLADDADIYY